MKDIKFVIYSQGQQRNEDSDLLAYEIRAHVARHTHAVRQRKEHRNSRRNSSVPQGPDTGSDKEGPLSLVQRPTVFRTKPPKKLSHQSPQGSTYELSPPEDDPLTPHLPNDISALLRQFASPARNQSWQIAQPQSRLGLIIPLSYNDLMLPDETSEMLGKGKWQQACNILRLAYRTTKQCA